MFFNMVRGLEISRVDSRAKGYAAAGMEQNKFAGEVWLVRLCTVEEFPLMVLEPEGYLVFFYC